MPTDTELLDWLEQELGTALVNDDAGRWAVVQDGWQNCPDTDGPTDITTTFHIKAADWRPSVREAIDAAWRLASASKSSAQAQ